MNAIFSRQPAAHGFFGTSEPGEYLLLDVQLPRINLSFCFSLDGLSRASLTVLLMPLFLLLHGGEAGSCHECMVCRTAFEGRSGHQINGKATGRDRTPLGRNGLCFPPVK